MSTFKSIMAWAGIIVLGLAHGVLEDLMFMRVLVEYAPMSWDLTGALFFVFTVPLAQLMVLAITGTFAWFVLGLHQLPKLVTFWLCWMVARAAFLFTVNNPVQDVLIYLAWITFWCVMIGAMARRSQA